MRVLVVSHGHQSYSIGGAEVASHTLFRALDQASEHEAFYLSRAPGDIHRHTATPLMSLGHNENETFLHTGPWDEFWLSNGDTREMSFALHAYLQRIDPDVVHFHHIIGFGVEAIALVRRVLPQARIVITLHEYLAICANHGQMITPVKHRLCHKASPASCNRCFPQRSPAQFFSREQHIRNHLLLADGFVSPSQFLADRFIDWGLPAERFRVIENGLVGTQAPARTLRAGGRRDRFAFFGQITEFKGLHVVLDAIGRIPAETWGDATLTVFGGNLEYQPEAFQQTFETLLASAGRRARLFGSYRQQELATLMADVDWVIMPSIWWENSPVVIQEAFLHRRPLLVSGIGGMAEKVRHDVDGLHFRTASPESLADAITRALTEEELWSRLSDAAPRPPDAAEVAAQHLAFYRDLGSAARH